MSRNPLEDDPERDNRIRERAYHLWKTDGEPQGRDAEYWERARELIGMAESAGSGQKSPTADAARRINGQIVDEAALEENLGEFPGRQTDQGDRRMTPARKNAVAAKKPAAAAVAKKTADPASKPTPPKQKATAIPAKVSPSPAKAAPKAAAAAEPAAGPTRKPAPVAATKPAATPAPGKIKLKGKRA